MEELVRFLATELVEEPQAVHVTTKETKRTIVIKLNVNPDDVGRVIGKGGRVANAVRGILRASNRDDERQIILDID